MDEKDSRLKYVEMPREFRHRANDIHILCKQSLRACEVLAKKITNAKTKDHIEFEKNEALKDFVLKTSQANEKTLELLIYINGFLAEIAEDAKVLIDGAILRDKLKDQSLKIENLIEHRESLVKNLYDSRKNQKDSEQSGRTWS